MNHSTGKPNAHESVRIERIKTIGCVACRMRGVFGVLADAHHLLRGGRRIGHSATIALCPWHHRAIPFGDWLDHEACRLRLGPSLAEGSKPFHREFGSDAELLEYQNNLLESA